MKRSILLTIEDAEWNMFKSKVALSGASMAEVLKGFIRTYTAGAPPRPGSARTIEGPDAEKSVAEEPGRPALGADVESTEESTVESSEKRPKRKRPRPNDIALDRDVLRYARTFSIPVKVEGKDNNDLKEDVMDAIEGDFEEHAKLGGEEFARYKADNMPMLRWFNDNRA